MGQTWCIDKVLSLNEFSRLFDPRAYSFKDRPQNKFL